MATQPVLALGRLLGRPMATLFPLPVSRALRSPGRAPAEAALSSSATGSPPSPTRPRRLGGPHQPGRGAASFAGPSGPAGIDSDDAADRARMRSVVADAAGVLYSSFFENRAAFEAEVCTDALTAFQARLGHDFEHPFLLRAALTHSSFRAETTPSFVQMLLAWIGDAALQSIASDELILRYGAAAAAVGSRIQSPLSIARTQVLSRGGCARNARILGLDAPGLIITGQSYKGHYKGHYEGQVSKDMLGETFEACIGAVTLDAGRAASRAAYLRADPFPVAALKDLGGVYAEAAEAEAALAAAAAAAQAGGASLSEQQQPAGG